MSGLRKHVYCTFVHDMMLCISHDDSQRVRSMLFALWTSLGKSLNTVHDLTLYHFRFHCSCYVSVCVTVLSIIRKVLWSLVQASDFLAVFLFGGGSCVTLFTSELSKLIVLNALPRVRVFPLDPL